MSYMKLPGGGIILAFFLPVLFLSGCGESSNNANTPSEGNTVGLATPNAAKSNIEELSLIVNFPYETEDIVWKQDADRQTIIAVIRLTSEAADRAVADAGKFGGGQNVALPVETWFPDELIAQAEVSGDNTLKGAAYPANAFFLEPYNNGRLTRIEGVDYFILEMSAR